MSAAENKKLIQQAFAKWAEGDADAVFKLLADDVQWTVIGSTRVSRSYQSKREFLEGAGASLPASEVARELFAGTIADTQLDGLRYLISRTAYRPRELIQCARLALDAAVALRLSRINEEAVLRAEEEFSRWKLEHIVSENMHIDGELETVLERFRGTNRSQTFQAMDNEVTAIGV